MWRQEIILMKVSSNVSDYTIRDQDSNSKVENCQQEGLQLVVSWLSFINLQPLLIIFQLYMIIFLSYLPFLVLKLDVSPSGLFNQDLVFNFSISGYMLRIL